MSGEDQIRRALSDLAPRPAADDAAFAGVERAVSRRRRRQAVGRVAAVCALLGLAAGGAALVRASGDDPPVVETPAQPGPSREPESGTTGPERVRFANVTFELPEGWTATRQDAPGPQGQEGEMLCVAPTGDPGPVWQGCGGLQLFHGWRPGYQGRPYEKDGPWGFAHAEEPAPCPVGVADPAATEPDLVVAGPDGRAPVDSGVRPVGNRTADYNQWSARCSGSNFTFTPRAWSLPTSKIVIFDVLGHPETEAILGSFRFDGETGAGR
jgi:hypothetical protein